MQPAGLNADPAALTERIYEASVLPEFWAGLLADMAAVTTGGEGIIFSRREAEHRMVASSQRYHDLALEYFARYRDNERTRRLLSIPRAGFVSDAEAFGPGEREALDIFRDFFIPRGYGNGVATVIPLAEGDQAIVHFEGPFSPASIDRKLIDWLDALRPHLARSVMLSTRLAFERARTAVETLAALGLPACAVRASGAVIVANREFEAEAAVWTTRAGERIALHDRRADAQLRTALASGEAGIRSLPVRAADEVAAILHVVPVRRAARDIFTGSMAILVLARRSKASTQAVELLQAFYDLTPTEAALAARIAAGHTVHAIAGSDARSVHTVRQHLKSVFAKTGCHRQADLTRLFGQLAPVIRPEASGP